MIDAWLESAVSQFWLNVGYEECFPRALEQPALWALPVMIVKLPRLRVVTLTTWLKQYGIATQFDYADRPLRGCLIARAGKGMVVIDGADSEDQQRFTLAHEIAHFLMDYLWPRIRAIEVLGETITEVLDGVRLPSLHERIAAVLNDTQIGVHTHLMERHIDSSNMSDHIVEAETRADRLALELLAPRSEVQRRIAYDGSSTRQEALNETTGILQAEFGLPRDIAEAYASYLISRHFPALSIREWLGV